MTADRRVGRISIRAALVTFGLFGWATFATFIWLGFADGPPSPGFDLELLLRGGRRVAAGVTPYEPGMLAGTRVRITELFYSYPPLVAQATSLVAAVPTAAVLSAMIVTALGGLAVVARALRDRIAPTARSIPPALAAIALAPLWFPFTVGALFGNLDTLFPALYGLLILGAVADGSRDGDRRRLVTAGIALALASITKLHPAVLGLWFVARGFREWRVRRAAAGVPALGLPVAWIVVGVSAVTVGLIVMASLVVGGVGPWLDYVTVLRASANVDLLDPRNIGPAAQLAMLLGLGPTAMGPLQAAVLGVVLAVTVVAALRIDDPLESLTWAAFASLAPLPVTWFHHFGALIPFGLAAALRADASGSAAARRRTLLWIGLAFAVQIFAFGIGATWLLLPVIILAVRASRTVTTGEPTA